MLVSTNDFQMIKGFSSMNLPKYSIITPVFNRESTLKRCLTSVLNQDFNDFEHVIVDDGSIDKSIFEIESFIKKTDTKPSKLLVNKENKGVNYARNKAINNSNGKYLIFLDSDDYLTENALKDIDDVINIDNGGHQHYMFSIDYRASDAMVATNDNKVVFYSDWLKGDVTGDFVHVIERNVLIQFPFFEQFMANEILNWLRIFRFCGKSLFTNICIVNVDRGDFNSLSRQGSLLSESRIRSQLEFRCAYIELYGEDLKVISSIKYEAFIKKTILLYLACSEYKLANLLLKEIDSSLSSSVFRCVSFFRVGSFVQYLITLKSKLSTLIK
jgi:glycosyltransferase involved in cell wall biosynthesis